MPFLKLNRGHLLDGRWRFPGSVVELEPHKAADWIYAGVGDLHPGPAADAGPPAEPTAPGVSDAVDPGPARASRAVAPPRGE